MLDQVKSVAAEDRLDGIKRAKGTRAKIRNLMSALFTHATRCDANGRIIFARLRKQMGNSRITLDVYTQAVGSNKRAAQSKVVRMMVPNLGEMKGETHPQKTG
jgi:hypothetical protein